MSIRSDESRVRRNARRSDKRRDKREMPWDFVTLEGTAENLPRCATCGCQIVRSRRSTRRYCGGGCRQQAYRDRARVVAIEQNREPWRG